MNKLWWPAWVLIVAAVVFVVLQCGELVWQIEHLR